MNEQTEITGMLDLLTRPSFCVKESLITTVNASARNLLLTPGTDIHTLLLTGQEEYETFSQGCMYLKLNLTPGGCGAAVVRWKDQNIFILDQQADDEALQAISLAAVQLRSALGNVIASVGLLDNQSSEKISHLNHSLHQMLRLVGNMSDAAGVHIRLELRNAGAVMDEILEKAAALLEQAGVTLLYEGLDQEVMTLMDYDQLERAVLNMISNAVKFSPANSRILVRFLRRGKLLHLSVEDPGCGIGNDILSTVFSRYLRQPGIEDSRHGFGLGMVLIRAVASAHGGAVLIDRPGNTGTRVTMTIAVQTARAHSLSGPTLRIDYAGGRSQALIELSDCLPSRAYEKE